MPNSCGHNKNKNSNTHSGDLNERTTSGAGGGGCGGSGSENTPPSLEDAVSLINNDSCARTPKIVGKLGNLDSTQLLLSANINHNHHEQQQPPRDGSGDRRRGGSDGGSDGGPETAKSVEWDKENEKEKKSLRRRKSGYCELPSTAENRRRKSSGRLSGAEDAVSVGTGS